MRRKAGVAVGVCAALVLAGAAGVTAYRYVGDEEGRPVGTWHDAPGVDRTPVAAEQSQQTTILAPVSPGEEKARADGKAGGAEMPATASDDRAAESAPSDGRQSVGELVWVNRLLGYLGRNPQRETFRYPGASYVKLHFSRMALLPGDYVTVQNADGSEHYHYKAPKVLNVGTIDKWAMSVTGDTVIVKVHRAASPLKIGGRLGLTIDKVARGYSRTEQARVPDDQLTAPGRSGREESVCGVDTSSDAVCYRSADPVAYTRSKAIARLLINGTELCTGWRVGAKNRMITNNHCLTRPGDADETEVWFNYQCATCGGDAVLRPTKVWGKDLLSTDHDLDYTLFTVGNFDAVKKFGYLVFDGARPAKGQELYVPQHPAGEPTRIAGTVGERAGNCAVADPGYAGYAPASDVSYYCDTEGGSSGSPVLSRKTNKVVALHHFGGCPNSGVRGDLLAAKLRAYL